MANIAFKHRELCVKAVAPSARTQNVVKPLGPQKSPKQLKPNAKIAKESLHSHYGPFAILNVEIK